MEKIKDFFFKNQSIKQTVTKNTFWLFSSEVVGRLLKMALVIYAARVLGAEGWGVFSYALSLGSLLMIFSDIGLGTLITREATQKKEGYKNFVATAMLLKGFILCLSTILIIIIAPEISHIAGAQTLFPIIAIVLFFDSLRDLGLSMNMISEKMERDMVVKTLMNASVLGLGIILLKINLIPKSVALAYAIGSAVGFVVVLILIRKDLKELLNGAKLGSFKNVLKVAIPFAMITLITTIMTSTDIYMLGIWRDATEIGFYASAQRIQQFILIIPVMLGAAIFPTLSRLANTDDIHFSKILEKSVSALMLIAIPVALGGTLLARELVILFFGNGYLGTVPILRILLLALLISFPLVILSNAILSYNKQKSIAIAYLLGAISNILLNFLLIKNYGAVGSAVATLISGGIITIYIWLKMKSINNFRSLINIGNVVFSTCIMLGILVLCQYFNLHVIITVLISAISYIGVLILLKDPLWVELKKMNQQL